MKFLSILLLSLCFHTSAGTIALTPDGNGFDFRNPKYGKTSDDGKYTFFYEKEDPYGRNSFPYETISGFWLKNNETGNIKPIGLNHDGTAMYYQESNHYFTSSGRFAVITASADGTAPNDEGFVYDVESDSLTSLNYNANNERYDQAVTQAQISDDGKYAVFMTASTNVEDGITRTINSRLYRKNLDTGEVIQISKDINGNDITNLSLSYVSRNINHDGSKILFVGRAGADTGVTNTQALLWDENKNNLVHVSTEHDGTAINGQSYYLTLSYYGHHALFGSKYNNHTHITSSTYTLYYKSLLTDKLINLDVLPDGTVANQRAELTFNHIPSINGNGSLVSYISRRTNFDPDYNNNAYHMYIVNIAKGEHYGHSYMEGYTSSVWQTNVNRSELNTTGDKVTMSARIGSLIYNPSSSGIFLRDVDVPVLQCGKEISLNIGSSPVNTPPPVDKATLCPNEVNLTMIAR